MDLVNLRGTPDRSLITAEFLNIFETAFNKAYTDDKLHYAFANDDDNNKTHFIKEFEKLIGIIEDDKHQESEPHWKYAGTSALLKEVDDNNEYKVRNMPTLRVT